MKRAIILVIVAIDLALTPRASLGDYVAVQQEKVFTSDGVIQDGDVYTTVRVYDTPPDHTTVNMTGGEVGDADGDMALYTYDRSTVNISGGKVYDLKTHDQSEVNINGGAVGADWGSYMESHGASTINIYDGGSFAGGSLSQFSLFDSSAFNIFGGRVDVLVGVANSSVVNVLDGYVLQIGTSENGNGTVNVHGGTIDSFRVNTYIADTTTVNIYAYNVVYDPHDYWDPEGWWVTRLTGTAFDGTEITWRGLPDPATHPNINIIPEPSSLIIWVCGSLGLLHRRREIERKRTLITHARQAADARPGTESAIGGKTILLP